MYESRSKAPMRLHAGQLEDVTAGTQRGCDIPKTSFARCGKLIQFYLVCVGEFLVCMQFNAKIKQQKKNK